MKYMLSPEELEKVIQDNSRRFKHYLLIRNSDANFIIKITNKTKDDLTSADITNFIHSLPEDAYYPVSIISKKIGAGTTTSFPAAIKNEVPTGYAFKLVYYSFNKAITDDGLNGFQAASEINSYNLEILSQYAIEN